MNDSPSRERNLNDLNIPKFTIEQIDFFERMIPLVQKLRLSLVPPALGNDLFDLQWACYQSLEMEYQWLIDSTSSIIDAEYEERVHKESYDPQKELERNTSQTVLSAEEILQLL